MVNIYFLKLSFVKFSYTKLVGECLPGKVSVVSTAGWHNLIKYFLNYFSVFTNRATHYMIEEVGFGIAWL